MATFDLVDEKEVKETIHTAEQRRFYKALCRGVCGPIILRDGEPMPAEDMEFMSTGEQPQSPIAVAFNKYLGVQNA